MMSDNIAILLALNDEFILSMKTFLLSLVDTNPEFNYDILVLSDGNLSNDNVDTLKKIYKRITVIEAKKHDYSGCLPTTQTWGFNLFYRFDVFDLKLSYDRIIIFDSDMIFLKNIQDLFTYNYDFAACEKYLGIPEINGDANKKRFNCGLMSISNKYFNAHIKKDLIDIASGKNWSSDQPVFNKYFENLVHYLPQSYNVVSSIANVNTLDTAHIIQYHGFKKPWHSDNKEECFQDDIKQEMLKNNSNPISYIKTVNRLKKIFTDYQNRANSL